MSLSRWPHLSLRTGRADTASLRALERYTSYAHPAGSGFDFLSALNLKNEWERELGLRVSGPEDNLYDAGSAASQARILDGMDKAGVWVDTVSGLDNLDSSDLPGVAMGGGASG